MAIVTQARRLPRPGAKGVKKYAVTSRPTGASNGQKGARPMPPASPAQTANAVLYRTTTHGIEVTVTPHYLEDKSSPAKGVYFWAYTIEIINRGSEKVQLRTRHWRITDARGRLKEVRGPGVVGEEPVLE